MIQTWIRAFLFDLFYTPQIGAKFTNAGIASDEFNQPNLNLSYDGKRDRWNGYDPGQHKAIIEEYQKVEDAKRELRAKKLEQGK